MAFLNKYQNQQITLCMKMAITIRFIITDMNKQLERDLLCSIQSLKATQLNNVLSHYMILAETQVQKNVLKKGMSFECEVSIKGQSAKGFGRTQQQSVSNATKGLLSVLVGKNMDVQKITKSLKYKNEQQQLQRKQLPNNNWKDKENSLVLDDISMIQPYSRDFLSEVCQDKKNRDKCTCDCIFYDMHQYNLNQVKHLQARVNLLTQQNMLLKKMLLCGSKNHQLENQKQNNSYQLNSNINSESKIKS